MALAAAETQKTLKNSFGFLYRSQVNKQLYLEYTYYFKISDISMWLDQTLNLLPLKHRQILSILCHVFVLVVLQSLQLTSKLIIVKSYIIMILENL
jgi:hypothetical protein